MRIPMNKIICKADRDMGDLTELKSNIAELGLLQPILLKKNDDDTYTIVDGRRRYTACLELVEMLPEAWYTLAKEGDEKLAAFASNTIRKPLTLAEEIKKFSELGEKYSVNELAGIFGKSENYIALRLNLANLVEDWQEVLENPEDFRHWSLDMLSLVAREPEDVQSDLFDDLHFIRNKKELLSKIAHEHCKLKYAPWDICSKCKSCKKRTDSCDLLFADYPADDAECLDKACYEENELKHFQELKRTYPELYLVKGDGINCSWGTPLYEWLNKNNAMWSGAAKTPKDGEIPNAVIVGGPRSGNMCVVAVKKIEPVKTENDADKLANLEKTLKKRRFKKAVAIFKERACNIDRLKEYDETILLARFWRVAIALGIPGVVDTYKTDVEAIVLALEKSDPDKFENIFDPVVREICRRCNFLYGNVEDFRALGELIYLDVTECEKSAELEVPPTPELIRLREKAQKGKNENV